MTPNVRDVLQGCVVALSAPPSDDAGAEYAGGRMSLVVTLTMLAAAEAEHAAGAAIAENADIRALFAEALAHDAGGRLTAAARETDSDLSTPALDAANARLRRLLIELHERVETGGDQALDGKILALYGRMAERRRLALPQG